MNTCSPDGSHTILNADATDAMVFVNRTIFCLSDFTDIYNFGFFGSFFNDRRSSWFIFTGKKQEEK